MAGPVSFSRKLAEKICDLMSSGKTLTEICKLEGMPNRVTVFRWLRREEPEFEQFRKDYDIAREALVDFWADQIISIADDTSEDVILVENKSGELVPRPNNEFINRSRLRVDSRKWIMSKLVPKKYGDRLITEQEGATRLVIDKMVDAPPQETREEWLARIQRQRQDDA